MTLHQPAFPQLAVPDTAVPHAEQAREVPWSSPEPPRFDGDTFDAEQDQARLTGQCLAIFALMKDGQWRTLAQIAEAVQAPEASVSAQLRHLRKERFGSHEVEKRRTAPESGLYEYRIDAAVSRARAQR